MTGTTCLEHLPDGSVKVNLSAFTSHSRRVLFMIDPATAAEIASAAADYYKNRQEGEWKAQVGDKLDAILAKMEEIVRAIADAVDKIIANDNENWTDFYTSNLKQPGLTWQNFSAGTLPLSDKDSTYVASMFPAFSQAVGSIALNGKFKSLGYVLAPVMRLAFPYTLLALRLADGKISPTVARSGAVKFAYDYLAGSVDENDASSLASALKNQIAHQTHLVAYMESWANNRWVRVSDYDPGHPAGGRNSGGDGDGSPASVRVARLVGGAIDPQIAETAVVYRSDNRYGVKEYDGFPGSISVGEDEKARIYVTDRLIKPNIAARNALSAKINVLSDQVTGIQKELLVIKDWMETVP